MFFLDTKNMEKENVNRYKQAIVRISINEDMTLPILVKQFETKIEEKLEKYSDKTEALELRIILNEPFEFQNHLMYVRILTNSLVTTDEAERERPTVPIILRTEFIPRSAAMKLYFSKPKMRYYKVWLEYEEGGDFNKVEVY